MEPDPDLDSADHSHCETCCRRKCSFHQCPQVDCNLPGCPARFHKCKQSDHEPVCQMIRVSCINKTYGCPLEMPRGKIGSHLKTCPASVIMCRMEWNRWPMHSVEKGWKAPLPFQNPHVKCGQLDVALAMRDQHVLMESFKVPLRTRRILRNPLTQRYPAVPIANTLPTDSDLVESPTSGTTSQTLSDDDSETPWDLNHDPPGLQQSVYNQLYAQAKRETERLNQSIEYVSGRQGLARLAEIARKEEEMKRKAFETEKKLAEAQISPSKSVKIPESFHLNANNVTSSPKEEDEFDVYCKEKKLHEILGVDLRMHFMSSVMPKPVKILTFQCAHEFRRDEYPWHIKNFHVDIQSGLDHWFEQRCPLAYLGCTFSFQRFKPKVPLGSIVHSNALHTLGFSREVEKPVNRNTSRAGSYEEDIQTLVGRERLREATPEIFTSVKCESVVKVTPRYSSVPTSRETSPFPSPTNTEGPLASLPFEILQKIARHLDGFSINNLSMTCHLLQNVACSLLDEMGVVSLVWEKKQGEACLWTPTYKRWHFSKSFTAIKDWGFQNQASVLSEHLKVCPFNRDEDKNIHTEPQKVMEEILEDEVPHDRGELMFLKKVNTGLKSSKQKQ